MEGLGAFVEAGRGELRMRSGDRAFADSVRVVRSVVHESGNAICRVSLEFQFGPSAASTTRHKRRREERSPDRRIVLPELSPGGLELWSMDCFDHHVRCIVTKIDADLVLRVADETTGLVVAEERYPDIVRLVNRSEDVRARCLAMGWSDAHDGPRLLGPTTHHR